MEKIKDPKVKEVYIIVTDPPGIKQKLKLLLTMIRYFWTKNS